MNSRERVLAALNRQEPDRVPYCELAVDRALAQVLMGWGKPQGQAANLEANAYSVDEANNLLLVNGAVPGPNGGWLIISATNKVG